MAPTVEPAPGSDWPNTTTFDCAAVANDSTARLLLRDPAAVFRVSTRPVTSPLVLIAVLKRSWPSMAGPRTADATAWLKAVARGHARAARPVSATNVAGRSAEPAPMKATASSGGPSFETHPSGLICCYLPGRAHGPAGWR